MYYLIINGHTNTGRETAVSLERGFRPKALNFFFSNGIKIPGSYSSRNLFFQSVEYLSHDSPGPAHPGYFISGFYDYQRQ
jgi:hypothetical protein